MKKYYNWFQNLKEPWKMFYCVGVLLSPFHLGITLAKNYPFLFLLSVIPTIFTFFCLTKYHTE